MIRTLLTTIGFWLMLSTSANAQDLPQGADLKDGKFQNTEIDYTIHMRNIYDMAMARLRLERNAAEPINPLPVHPITREDLRTHLTPTVYRLGHSTMLIHVDDKYLLTDPMFSQRASMVQFAGPKRFHDAPISIADLPRIHAVIISHDHYDHLDKDSILSLMDKTDRFITPLKVGNHLRDWGVPDEKITELDWWQNTDVDGIKLTATPAQHFSGRWLTDRDETLWASWVIEAEQAKLFFSGDSGYFKGFKEIGERFGPFDLTMIEAGAYNIHWHDIHMLPEESVQAHIDLKGRAMMPIHNSTFDLAMHEWYEPLEVIHTLAQQRQVQLITPKIGEPISVLTPQTSYAWWQQDIPDLAPQLAENPATSQ